MDKKFAKTIRNRLADLREADEAYARAEGHRGRCRHQQAAKQAEHAADLYRGCGLGVLAHVEDGDSSDRCGRHAKALPI